MDSVKLATRGYLGHREFWSGRWESNKSEWTSKGVTTRFALIETAKDPHALHVSNVEVEQVREAIMRLPLEFREIILLREYGELSYQETAALLDCRPWFRVRACRPR